MLKQEADLVMKYVDFQFSAGRDTFGEIAYADGCACELGPERHHREGVL